MCFLPPESHWAPMPLVSVLEKQERLPACLCTPPSRNQLRAVASPWADTWYPVARQPWLSQGAQSHSSLGLFGWGFRGHCLLKLGQVPATGREAVGGWAQFLS